AQESLGGASEEHVADVGLAALAQDDEVGADLPGELADAMGVAVVLDELVARLEVPHLGAQRLAELLKPGQHHVAVANVKVGGGGLPERALAPGGRVGVDDVE